MTSLFPNHPDHARLQRHGWICSMAFHAIMGTCAVALLSGLRMPLVSEQFKWNVAMVEAPKTQVDRFPESKPKPKPTSSKPQVVKSQPAPPQPVIETVQQKVVQPVQNVPQVVQRQVTTLNQTASVVTQRIRQSETSKPVATTTTREAAVHEAQVVTARTPVIQETAAEPVVQRAGGESGEPVVQSQQTPSRHTSETMVERTATDFEGRPAAQSQQAFVEQAQARSLPATKSDYGWLMKALLGRVDQLKNYPYMARINHWEGKVVLRAVIRDDGQVLMVDVHESSGRSILDNDAIETLRKASPLKLEHPLGKPQVAILMPISYSLR